TRTSDTAKPNEPTPAPAVETTMEPASSSSAATPLLQFVNLDIDGIVYRVPLGSTVAVPVSKKSIKINVSAAP
ncbi:MAG TPA: hypothetical protein VE842_13355, partial [Pyrinomonadaceae bacterium]|nr:hypothetical protein [Pyrinomonadaceae bacterium]